jgi:toxin YhaV
MAQRWSALRAEVERRRRQDQRGYVHSPAAKMLKAVAALMFKEIPADPNAKRYRLGHALGKPFTWWRRAKFFGRFRLFFRFHSRRRAIVYVWLNDEQTLRKAGARTDPYAVFAGMLAAGQPPNDFDDLLGAAGGLAAQREPPS